MLLLPLQLVTRTVTPWVPKPASSTFIRLPFSLWGQSSRGGSLLNALGPLGNKDSCSDPLLFPLAQGTEMNTGWVKSEL